MKKASTVVLPGVLSVVLTLAMSWANAPTGAWAQIGLHKVMQPSGIKWMPVPPMLPAGAKIAVLTGDPAKKGPFTARLQMPDGYVVPPHWHSQAENVTVIAGTLHLGMGGKVDKSKAQTLPAGAFGFLPAKMQHFAYAQGQTIVQLHGIGPFDIHYVNPADDPQHAHRKPK